MNLKKKKTLSKQRPLYLGIGLMVSLSITLLAFEWRSFYDSIKDIVVENNSPFMEEELLRPIKMKKPPMPKTNKVNNDKLDIVKDIKDVIPDDKKPVKGSDDGDPNLKDTDIPDDMGETPTDEGWETFTIVEDMPRFPGTPKYDTYEEQMESFNKKLGEFLGKYMKYPERCKDLGISGKVFIQFIVEADGTISSVKVLRGICTDADDEAVRVISKLPTMVPGKQRGMPVRVLFQIPIQFSIK